MSQSSSSHNINIPFFTMDARYEETRIF